MAGGIKCLVVIVLILLGPAIPLFTPAPAMAATTAELTLSPKSGHVGQSILVQGSGFLPLAQVSIDFDDDQVAIAGTDELGEFSAEFDVPDLTSSGSVVIEALDDSDNATFASIEFAVDNTPPVADEQHDLSVGENDSELIGLTASDANGDTLALEIVDGPSHGTLSDVDEDTGEVLYTPDAGYSGPDGFTFRAFDGLDYSTAAEISLTVVAASEPPVISNAEYTILEDHAVDVALEATDSDSPSVSFMIVSGPEHGSLGQLDNLGPYTANVTYTPSSNYHGEDSFTFRADGGDSDSETGTATITILAVNDAPTAIAKSVDVDIDSKKKVTIEASDPDNDHITFAIVSDPDHGNLTGSPPNLTYTPDEGYFGSDSFRFSASDSIVSSNTATVSISIGSDEDDDTDEDYYDYDEDEEEYYDDYEVDDDDSSNGNNSDNNGYGNAKPVADPQELSGTEDTPIEITLTAKDLEEDVLTFGIIDYPSFGEISNFNESSGVLTYTPSLEYSGIDSFTFSAMDNYKESKKETITISIAQVNDPPSPVSMNLTAEVGERVSVMLSAHDAEGDALQYAMYTKPSNGVISGAAPDLLYEANPDFTGYDKFLFTVSDGRPDGRIGVISIKVGEVPAQHDDQEEEQFGSDEEAAAGEDNGGSGYDDESGNNVDDDNDDEKQDGADHEKHQENDDFEKEGNSSTAMARVDKSNMMVMMSWDHHGQDQRGIESTLHMEFAEVRTRVPIDSHIWYDLVMLDDKNNEILRKNDLVAINSEDTQEIEFPADGTYHFEVNVKGRIDKSSNAITRDSESTGKALGIVVVPEFNPSLIFALVAAVMIPLVAIARYRGGKSMTGLQ
ncbi:MAG TPA: Ig-like domain-containing protein [Nitrososphaera sp.]|nr:Ig-like domain-containing protein [Nitrososphaera sp.]